MNFINNLFKELYDYIPEDTLVFFWIGEIFRYFGEKLLAHAFTYSAFFVLTYIFIMFGMRRYTYFLKVIGNGGNQK